MLAGSMAVFLNTFAPTEQLSAQPYTTAPNWEEQVGVYTIYSGQNAGVRDGEISLLWLKAFGVQSVAVPGPHSPEYWKPFVNPRKFDGMLPVLWQEDDTTIYRVPERSASLAHVLRPDQLERSGLSTDQLPSRVARQHQWQRPKSAGGWNRTDGRRSELHRRLRDPIGLRRWVGSLAVPGGKRRPLARTACRGSVPMSYRPKARSNSALVVVGHQNRSMYSITNCVPAS
jgi:hypothetical protein